MTFSEFLMKRRIAEAAFSADDPVRYARWQDLYAQMHPNSFYNSVKMVLNDVRRRYLLVPEPTLASAQKEAVTAAPARPRAVARRAAPTKESAEQPSAETTPVNRPPAEIIAQLSNEETPSVERTVPTPTSAEDVEKATPKPGRARPVFKRPAPEAPAVEADTAAAEAEKETNLPAYTQETTAPKTLAAKPSRPRPVFKGPASAPEATAASTEPSAEPPAPETALPETAPPAEETKPKSPRPRPVFKRPAPGESEKPVAAEPLVSGSLAENTPKTETDFPEPPVQELAKPPRPRPVFKRPSPSGSEAEKPE
ncbi:hypothetical protein TH63_15705 [Rufibacter radiotolerans]|uniref:Uncharacterized protein n=1 Tax=Rufibacter radiotolerans TaxID=1379910 RepID=A0A0H4VSI6_9BACT|nr:hypothetical protein [Rufibacter radiotolerans]AKQ46739.1 hypothetical protein TH63_15705 [Rufibacter radiotolerans]